MGERKRDSGEFISDGSSSLINLVGFRIALETKLRSHLWEGFKTVSIWEESPWVWVAPSYRTCFWTE